MAEEEPEFSSSEDDDLELDEVEEEEDVINEPKEKRGPMTDDNAKYNAKIASKTKDDELLFNAKEDEKNEKWVNKHLKGNNSGRQTDAVLNCPCCFTPLCYDCQRHEVYRNQFRAMFVLNCEVDMNQVLSYGKSKKKRTRDGRVAQTGPDSYHPVKCTGCGTEVAVFDNEEVYHFFNVLPNDY